ATDQPAADPAPESKKLEPSPAKPVAKKPDATLSPKAAEYKGRIEEAISEHGFSGRAKVQGFGNTLTLAGKLKPAEHGTLLSVLRDGPAEVHVVDHIEYDDAPAAAATGNPEGAHPVPRPSLGAIHIVTDVLGATAALRDPNGRVVSRCQTPCSFNNLDPEQ